MIKVVYGEKQVAESGSTVSPSAGKPKQMAELLQRECDYVEFVEPIALSVEDLKLCHDSMFVDDVMNLRRKNGFGTICQSVVDSLPYTNGACYQAAKLSLTEKYPVAALVAGFHHAGYSGFEQLGYFCTFNGLMIAAMKLRQEGHCQRVAIVDCDNHWGNGTDNILDKIDKDRRYVINISFGRYFHEPAHAKDYLYYFEAAKKQLEDFKPNVIIYQSGSDVHVDDPFGGVLNEEQMFERDIKMFRIAKEFNIPISWCLAGGYQIDKDGKYDFVLKLHLNTFKACKEVYNP
jgi:acetoin utilization deacetylase AcuC-like enzyme